MNSDHPCRECGEPLAEDATASDDSDVCDYCSSASSQVTDSQDNQGRKKRWAALAVGIAGAAAAYVGVKLARGSGADRTWAEDDDGDSDHWDDDDWDDDESLSVWDAADIWRSSGEDEDYTFGYSSEDLRQAADEW